MNIKDEVLASHILEFTCTNAPSPLLCSPYRDFTRTLHALHKEPTTRSGSGWLKCRCFIPSAFSEARRLDFLALALASLLRQGDFIVIRYEGPKGGPGMREMLTPTCHDCRRQRGRRRNHHCMGLHHTYTSSSWILDLQSSLGLYPYLRLLRCLVAQGGVRTAGSSQ